jgi:hypothetical protein
MISFKRCLCDDLLTFLTLERAEFIYMSLRGLSSFLVELHARADLTKQDKKNRAIV